MENDIIKKCYQVFGENFSDLYITGSMETPYYWCIHVVLNSVWEKDLKTSCNEFKEWVREIKPGYVKVDVRFL